MNARGDSPCLSNALTAFRHDDTKNTANTKGAHKGSFGFLGDDVGIGFERARELGPQKSRCVLLRVLSVLRVHSANKAVGPFTVGWLSPDEQLSQDPMKPQRLVGPGGFAGEMT